MLVDPDSSTRRWTGVAGAPSTLGAMSVTLVTGGVRSGKSRYAEALLAGDAHVTYVATGARGTLDPEWAARVAAHRARRPTSWTTVETLEVAGVLEASGGPVLVDCLGTWLTGVVDRADLWEDLAGARTLVREAGAALADALGRTARHTVVVTNEVGLSLVPDVPSGRFFQDELGRLNAAVAAVAGRVVLMVAGRALQLPVGDEDRT